MRTLLLVFCGLLVMNLSLEAKKKMKLPASQKTAITKQHKAMVKQTVKARKAPKAPKHRQSVN
jgi:hypothetical protein